MLGVLCVLHSSRHLSSTWISSLCVSCWGGIDMKPHENIKLYVEATAWNKVTLQKVSFVCIFTYNCSQWNTILRQNLVICIFYQCYSLQLSFLSVVCFLGLPLGFCSNHSRCAADVTCLLKIYTIHTTSRYIYSSSLQSCLSIPSVQSMLGFCMQ